MPKKTKKQKILAQYRKKLQKLEQSVPTIQSPNSPAPVSSYSYPVSSRSQTSTPQIKPIEYSVGNEEEFKKIKIDLKNTILLIIVLLSAQIAIWKLLG